MRRWVAIARARDGSVLFRHGTFTRRGAQAYAKSIPAPSPVEGLRSMWTWEIRRTREAP